MSLLLCSITDTLSCYFLKLFEFWYSCMSAISDWKISEARNFLLKKKSSKILIPIFSKKKLDIILIKKLKKKIPIYLIQKMKISTQNLDKKKKSFNLRKLFKQKACWCFLKLFNKGLKIRRNQDSKMLLWSHKNISVHERLPKLTAIINFYLFQVLVLIFFVIYFVLVVIFFYCLLSIHFSYIKERNFLCKNLKPTT